VLELRTLPSSERTVKKKHLIIVSCLLVLVAAYIVSIIPNIRFHREWDRTVQALRGLSRDRVDAAVQAFVRDRKAGTTPLTTVTFDELVSGGYLHTNDVAAFGGKQVVVFIGIDGSTPAAAYLRVHLTDSRDVVENADGSIMLEPKL
jgi:hypothetical protein